MEGRAPRFPDPTLEAIANEFVEVLRVKRDAEEKLVELFNKFAEEFVGYEQRFSDQEIRAITEEIEAMRAMIATRAEPSRSWSRGSISPRRPPRHTSCRTLRTSTRDTCTGSSATSTMIRCARPPAITSIYGPLWHAAAIRGTSCGGGKRPRQRRPRDFDSRLRIALLAASCRRLHVIRHPLRALRERFDDDGRDDWDDLAGCYRALGKAIVKNKPMTRKDRARVAKYLREAGWRERAIGAATAQTGIHAGAD
jgi:hypothetical protein